MNKIIITNSRLGKDVEIRQSNSGTTIGRFSVGSDRKFTSGEDKKTDWFNIVAFGKQAEWCDKYLHKGSKVNIIGRVQPDFYTNKDGNRVNTFDVICEEIEFAESKKEAEANAKVEKKADDGFADVPEDDGFANVDDIDSELPFR